MLYYIQKLMYRCTYILEASLYQQSIEHGEKAMLQCILVLVLQSTGSSVCHMIYHA